MQCIKCNESIESDSIYCRFCGKKQTKTERKALKNPNGYGSVVNLGGRRKKPWAVRMSYMVEGVQKYRYIAYCESKTEAIKRLSSEQVNPTSPKADITLKELFEEWKETPRFTQISKFTQNNYTSAFAHLEPLHNVRFTDLRAANYQGVIIGLQKQYKGRSSEPLSLSSKNKVKIFCGLLYKYAMENDICSKNYAEFIRIPKDVKKEKEIFNDIEIRTLENNDNIPYVDTILILIYTGLRINELFDLTKFSIDFDKNTITGGLKTDAGKNRVVPIHPKIQKYLKRWYDSAKDKLFFRDEGTVLTSDYYRKNIYYPLLERLDIPRKTPHATRHTCATLLAQAGADTNAIKQILGHTDYAFTADVYTHVDVEFLRNELGKVNS